MKLKIIRNPNLAVLTGFLFALPFVIINFIVALRVEPFYSFLGSFGFIRNSPYFPLFLLILLPVGAYASVSPMLKKENSKRKIYFINIATTVILLAVFILMFVALAEELYRCEILKIPNCD